MPSNGKPNGRFELPALKPISYSLTDGTDIPPPPDSPVEKTKFSTPPPPPPPSTAPEPRAVGHSPQTLPTLAPAIAPSSPAVSTTIGGNNNGTSDWAFDGSRGRTTAEVVPLSPASERRPSSIRRLFSRKSLNQNYTNGTNHNSSDENLNAASIQRPDSSLSFFDRPSATGAAGAPRKKSWFKRLGSAENNTGNGNNRTSVIYEEKPKPVRVGPPPPRLPELNQLKSKVQSDQGSLGGEDMFKNIK